VPDYEETTPAPTAIDPTKIYVRAFKGYLWSPYTKRLSYVHNREEVGPSTYNRPFSITLGYGFEHPIHALSPLDYPTSDTPDWVLAWARENWPALLWDLYVPDPTGGVVTEDQWWLVVNSGDLYEIYSAGQWAFLFDRDGQEAAYAARTADLRMAGFSV
jgi:hypothetical protein